MAALSVTGSATATMRVARCTGCCGRRARKRFDGFAKSWHSDAP
jgi:hypothetical protein